MTWNNKVTLLFPYLQIHDALAEVVKVMVEVQFAMIKDIIWLFLDV